MTFKELIDKSTVDWANKLIKEKTDSLVNDLNSVNVNDLIPGLNFDPKDAVSEFNHIKDQLPVLKTYADVFGYAKLNETDMNSVLQKGIDPQMAKDMFSDGNLTPNIAKIIAKVQIGSVFSIISLTKPLVTELLTKIGRETPIDEVNLDDINYLITKNIDEEVTDIQESDEPWHLLDEVSEEIKQLSDVKASWDKKDNDRQIIEIYLGKLRDKFLNDPLQRNILTHGAPMNSDKVKAATKIIADMSTLGAKVEFGYTLEQDFLKIKNN